MAMEAQLQPTIIEEVLNLLGKYTDRTIPPDQFLQDRYVNDEDDLQLGPDVQEIFYHIIRMEPVLLKLVKEYCQFRRRRHDDDILVLTVMIYLVVFKLTERSRRLVKHVLLSIHTLKAYNLLKYFTKQLEDAAVLLSQAASQVFDIDFVKEKIMKQFVEEGHVRQLLYDDIKEYLLEEKRRKQIPLTKPVGPSLLDPSSRPVRVPKGPSCTANVTEDGGDVPWRFSMDMPDTTYQEPAERKQLRKKSQQNRRQSQYLYDLANAQPFHCAIVDKSSNYNKTVAKIEEERAQQMQPKVKVKKPPDFKNVALPVKLNAATVLREGCRLQKEEEKSIKRVEEMTSGGVNSLYFEHLAVEMQRRQEEEHLAEIERKHLKGLLTHEEAALARQAAIERNKEKTAQVKKEKEELDRQMDEWKIEEERKVKELVQRCQISHQGAKEAQNQLHDRKAKVAQEMNEESKKLMERSLQEKHEELTRKLNLIAEIRALHMLHTLRVREVDLTQTAGVRLLCEMSIVELRERLALLRVELQDELEERQHFIRQQREKQHQLVSKTQEFIKIHRMARRHLNVKPDLKKVELPKTPELDYLRKQLEEKREMRKRAVCQQ